MWCHIRSGLRPVCAAKSAGRSRESAEPTSGNTVVPQWSREIGARGRITASCRWKMLEKQCDFMAHSNTTLLAESRIRRILIPKGPQPHADLDRIALHQILFAGSFVGRRG